MSNPSKTDLLKSLTKELLKEYVTYDGQSRKEFVYQAGVDADDGDQCLATQFVYDSTSLRIVKRKEFYTTWQSAWDI